MTAYSYLFGCVFMGLASLYYVATENFDEFHINEEVSLSLLYCVPLGFVIRRGEEIRIYDWGGRNKDL